MDQVRRSGADPRRDPWPQRHTRNRPNARTIRGTDQTKPHFCASFRHPCGGCHRRRVTVTTAHTRTLRNGHCRRRRSLRHPRLYRVGRTRLEAHRATEPQTVHLRARRSRHRWRRRDIHGGTTPHAYRRSRGARGFRWRRGIHNPHLARGSRAHGDGGGRCGRGPPRPVGRDPGAGGLLVGWGGGGASTPRTSLGIHAPMATAVADVAGARRDYLEESGGRYVHVIADGGLGTSGDVVKAIAGGGDAVMLGGVLARATDAPGGGYHWGAEAHHPKFPRGQRVQVGQVAPLANIVSGPAPAADGTANLTGALRRAMATTGYSELKEFQRVEVVVGPVQTS